MRFPYVFSGERVRHSKDIAPIVFQTILIIVSRAPHVATVAIEMHDRFAEAKDVQREPNPNSLSLDSLDHQSIRTSSQSKIYQGQSRPVSLGWKKITTRSRLLPRATPQNACQNARCFL